MESEVELPQGYEIVEEETPELPKGYEIVGEEMPYVDTVSQNLREQGVEPDASEEFERAAERGNVHATKGLISGLTFGLSEHVPGLKTEPNAATTTGELIGSVAPIEKFLKGSEYLYKLAQKSPYFKKTLGALGNLTGAFLGGAGYESAKDIAKGELPSMEKVLEHGAEWALLDGALRAAGAGGSFAVSLLKKSRATKQPEWKIVNEVYNGLREQGVDVAKDARIEAKALSILEDIGQPSKPKGIYREVKPKKIEEMNKSVENLSEPILPEAKPEELNINRVVEDTERKAIDERIASVGRRAADDAQLGKEVQEGINTAREAAKAEYKPFYNEVEEGARHITANPQSTARVAGNIILALEEIKTSPTGYSTVIKNLEDILGDIGYQIQRTKAPKGQKGQIELIVQNREVPLSRLTELGRRLNEVVEYDVLDKTVKDRLKPVVRAVKNDIRESLGAVNEDLLASWELAEEAFGVNAQKFGRDSIRKIRGTQAHEAIPKMMESATGLNDLRAVLPPAQMKDVERHVLEQMNKMTEQKAKDYLRKVQSGLSTQSREIADDIIRSKRPINKESIQSRRGRLAETIDEDLSSAMNTGKRPTKTLELWQNPRGQKLVRESLETHPQKKELLKYLENQTMQDMAQSILTKEGAIDAAKLKQMMENPAIRNNLRDLGGQEAVDFFEGLSEKMKGFKNNADRLVTEKLGVQKGTPYEVNKHGQFKHKIDTSSTGERGRELLKKSIEQTFPLAAKINKALDLLGFTGKVTLNLFTLIKFGFLKGALLPIATNAVKKMATSSKVRHAFNQVSKKQNDPVAFLAAVEQLGKALEEED